MSSDEMTSLTAYLEKKFDKIDIKFDVISASIQKDHDVLILSSQETMENKDSLDKLWKFSRKKAEETNAKLWRVTIACILLGSGSVGASKLIGMLL